MDRTFNIAPADRRIAAAGVAQVLGATGVLWMKTLGFAWNAEGRDGIALAPLLATQATDLRRALAPLSSRIRALGFFAPAALADLVALSPLAEEAGVPVVCEMAHRLETDHARVTALIRCIRPALEDIEDTASCLVLDGRLGAREAATSALAAFGRDSPPSGLLAESVLGSFGVFEASGDGARREDGHGALRR
ncbi:MAG: Dps family protein [Pseudomonadota bacterium]